MGLLLESSRKNFMKPTAAGGIANLLAVNVRFLIVTVFFLSQERRKNGNEIKKPLDGVSFQGLLNVRKKRAC